MTKKLPIGTKPMLIAIAQATRVARIVHEHNTFHAVIAAKYGWEFKAASA